MSFLMRGPYPGLITTTLLPAPEWGDSKALTATVTSLRSINGTLYTYVKDRNGRMMFHWRFQIARNKALELREFINSYFGKLIQITDHDGDLWIGYLRSNPFELMGAGRAGPNWPGGETMTIDLEFEER